MPLVLGLELGLLLRGWIRLSLSLSLSLALVLDGRARDAGEGRSGGRTREAGLCPQVQLLDQPRERLEVPVADRASASSSGAEQELGQGLLVRERSSDGLGVPGIAREAGEGRSGGATREAGLRS